MKLFLILLAVCLVSCGTEIEPSIEPPQPVITPNVLPPEAQDHGVFADVSTDKNAIWVEWGADASRKTSGYEIYRSTGDTLDGDGMLKGRLTIGRNEPSNDLQQRLDTLFRDTIDVRLGQRYYYQVRAFNRSATNRYTWSKPSQIRHYRLISSPTPIRPSTTNTELPAEGLDFSWTYSDQSEGGAFQVVVERVNPPMVMWSSGRIQRFGDIVIEKYPSSATPLEPNVLYRWRVKRMTSDGGGSSSYWQQFSIK
jgi:hypothetical protein